MNKDSFTDPRDGNVYKIVKIGNQIWMAENLNYTAKGSKCRNSNPAKPDEYGRLYDWETAMESCPEGWHLPSDDEWQTLIDFTGGQEAAGKKLKAKSGWAEPCNGTDDYGFSALPGGGIRNSFGLLEGTGNAGYWWTSTEDARGYAYVRYISSFNKVSLHRFNNAVTKLNDLKSNMYSVRCVKNQLGNKGDIK